MSMTAAEALRSVEPPVDDGGIDQALAELDVKIWTWTDAMLSARAAIKRSLAHREIFARGAEYSVGSAATAGTAGQAGIAPTRTAQSPPFAAGSFSPMADSAGSAPSAVAPMISSIGTSEPASAFGSSWGAAPAEPVAFQGQVQQAAGPAVANPYAAPSSGDWAPTVGVMQWPSADSATSGGNSGEITPVAWPTAPSAGSSWPTSDTPSVGAPVTSSQTSLIHGRSGDRAKKPAPPRVSPEETAARAARTAREESLMAQLDETSARRVRLLRRLDPDADIEQLIEKASQAQPRENSEKTDKASSWWRRK